MVLKTRNRNMLYSTFTQIYGALQLKGGLMALTDCRFIAVMAALLREDSRVELQLSVGSCADT